MKVASENLGLSDIGVVLDQKGGIVVNERMKTNISGIYAIGDVTNKSQLAHVAMAQAKVAAENIMGKDVSIDYSVIPNCIFLTPEVSSVGLDLDDAVEKGYEVCKGSFSYKNSGKAMAMGADDGFIHIISDKKTDKILGAQIVGAHASDLISEIAVAMQNGLTVKQVMNTIHPHPTLSEILVESLENIYDFSIHC